MHTVRSALTLFVSASLFLIGMLVITAQPANAATGTTPLSFPQTNGPVLDGYMMYLPQQVLVIGGTFTSVTEPSGRVVAAQNLAAIDVATGTVVYAGRVNSHVRTIFATNGMLYIGGDFTSVDGVARNHIAQLNAYSREVTGWKASAPNKVITLTATDQGVFYASGAKLNAVTIDTGALIWQRQVDQGPVMSLLPSPGGSGLFVGGLFEGVAGLRQHGLMEIYPIMSGNPWPMFAPQLLPDSESPPQKGGRETWNGEEVLGMDWDWSQPQLRLILATGGGTFNAIRSIEPSNGFGYWVSFAEGDVQGMAVAGDTIFGGWHRNHGNGTGNPWPFFAGQVDSYEGHVTSWDPGIAGDFPGDEAKTNGGVQDVLVTGDRVYYFGEFTKANAVCSWNTSVANSCTGGTNRKGIAVYPR